MAHLPKPRQYPKNQNCTVHQYGYELMKKMEVAESYKRQVKVQNTNITEMSTNKEKITIG